MKKKLRLISNVTHLNDNSRRRYSSETFWKKELNSESE